MESNEKMALWDSVQKTDPSHTKKVNQRGGFTSISAHYQVMRATEVFGPVGIGWGYDCGEPIFTGPFIIVPVKVWYRDRANTFGPIYGSAEIAGARPDSDAPKKAMTDALTKALSHLGFNADVFLGKFDDNKYVAAVTAEFAEKPETVTEEQAATLNDMIEATGADKAKFLEWLKVEAIGTMPASLYGKAKAALDAKAKAA